MIKKEVQGCSAAVLCGGRSSRMGRDKAELPFQGGTLLSRQVFRLREMGFPDVMASGDFSCPGARTVPDEIPGCGPLGGMHAVLSAARNPACLFLPVDMPLVPESVILSLVNAFDPARDEAVRLEHAGVIEPLVGVYSAGLAGRIGKMLAAAYEWPAGEEPGPPRKDAPSVKQFLDTVRTRTVIYRGEERVLSNCNTVEEYLRLCGKSGKT